MFTTYGSTFASSFQTLWPAIVNVAAELIIAIVIFIIGWIIGIFLAKLIEHIFKTLKVDEALKKAGIEEPLHRGGITLNSGRFIGSLVKWFIIVLFLVSSLQVLGLSDVNYFLAEVVVAYLPQVIIAVLMLLVAALIGDAMQKIVRASAGAAHFKAANFLGSFTKWIIWIFAILAVLIQLHIAADLIRILFTGVVVAGAIAFGIAFGLGGQQHASALIEKVKKDVSER